MSRPLAVFLPLAAPLDRAVERVLDDPITWLPEGSRASGPHTYRLSLHGAGFDRPVLATIGPTWLVNDGCWRTLAWTPAPSDADVLPVDRILPSFSGELGVHGDLGDHPTLVLSGTYDVPGAVVGTLIDQLALSRVARRSAERLLGDIGAELATTRPTSVG